MSDFPIERVLDFLAKDKAQGRYLSLAYTKSGVFTPELFFGGAQVGMTTSTKSGFWFAFNNIIMGHFRITLTAKGSSVGSATITGLPYAADINAQSGLVYAPFYQTMVGLTQNLFGRIAGGTSTINLQHGGATIPTTVTDANFANTSLIDVWFVYDASLALCKDPAVGWWIPKDA